MTFNSVLNSFWFPIAIMGILVWAAFGGAFIFGNKENKYNTIGDVILFFLSVTNPILFVLITIMFSLFYFVETIKFTVKHSGIIELWNAPNPLKDFFQKYVE